MIRREFIALAGGAARTRLPPDQRFGLRKEEMDGKKYWVFRP
jgi:hypothetical protein